MGPTLIMGPFFERKVDRETRSYREGLMLGLWDIEEGFYAPHPMSYTSVARLSIPALEGYRDAIDDSDDYPEPFDPERTLVP
jgi:hypothetical protein